MVSASADDSATATVAGLGSAGSPLSQSFALLGKIEVMPASEHTKVSGVSLSAPAVGTVYLRKQGEKASGRVFLYGQPADGNTVTIGLTGSTTVYRFKNTLAAAYDVKIGATVAETLQNLSYAILDSGGTEGVNYGSSTVANPYVDCSISSNVLTFTDKIGCNRLSRWACSSVGGNIALVTPSGGVDGALIATVSAGASSVYPAISLDDEGLTLASMPPSLDWYSDAVRVGGDPFSIHLANGAFTGTAAPASYQYSTQSSPTVWRNGLSSITSLPTAGGSQVVSPTEVVEWVRLRINNSSNTVAISVNAKVCY